MYFSNMEGVDEYKKIKQIKFVVVKEIESGQAWSELYKFLTLRKLLLFLP